MKRTTIDASHPRKHPRQRLVTLSLPSALVGMLDAARGPISRSRFVAGVLAAYLEPYGGE